MFKKITSLILATSVILSLSPNIFATNTDDLSDIFVSKNGSDSANGSIETPFATLEKALNTAKNTGQDVYIRGGTYYENIQISDIHNIEISNYNGEKVTFNGTTAIENNWIATTNEEVPSSVRENVYETTVNEDIWQLFKEDETLVAARFPNGSFDYEDGIGYIFNLKETTRHLSQAKDENGEFLSEFGHFYDENPSSTATNNGDYDEGNDVSYDSARTHLNEVGIDELSYSLEGANVVLHMGSWLSWANVVTEHEIYTDNFKFSKDFSGSGTAMNNNAILWGGGENGTGNATWNAKNLNGGQGYYFFEGLQCIDHENEWYYDKDTGKVYVYSENGAPTGNYFGKTQTYYLEMSNSSNVTINGIDCFATTLSVTDSTNITLENSNFLYPSYNKLVLDEYTRPEVTKFWNSNSTADANNTVRNCKFEYMDGPALEMNGKYNVIDNNLMHHIDYTTLGTGAEGTINVASADFAKITRNTIHTAGNSEGIRAGKSAEIMYNDLSNMSLLQHDGSLINIGASVQNGVQIRYNWVHDAPKSSIRFDTAGMGNADTVQYDENGTMAYNVTWNVGQMKIKGENHYIVGNTALTSNAAHKIGISVLYDPPMGGFNEKTLTFNNAGVLSGHFGVPTDIPSITQGGNFNGSVESLLVDPENLDFRPKSDLLINNGTTNFDASNEFGENPMEFFKSGQNSVSIGAYEYGDENYMIAGFKDEKASVPIPKDNGTKADTEFDLMWLSAYNSMDNRVYFGTNPENLQVKSTQTNNICSFTAEDELELNQTYYWRVDSFVDGKWTTGDVWSFETIPNIANVSSISQLENALLDNSIDVINVTSDITSNVDISRTESVEINLNSSAITGNVSINSDAYAVTINGDRGIIGDISINSPKSTVNINTPVTGDVNIANVFSFFNSSTANAVNVNGKGNIQSENPIFINTTERIDLVGDIGDVIFGEFSGVYPFTKAIVSQIDTITGLDEQIADKYNGIQLEILPKSIDIPVTLDKTFEKLTISRPSTVNGGNISRVDIKADGNINSSVETTNILTKDIELTNQGTIDILNSGVNFAIENLGTINQINLTANNLIITVLGENVPIFYTNLDPATIKVVDENGDEIIGAKVYKVLSAPQNLVGLAPTSQGGKGKISGITTEMEFSSDNGETYTKITDTDMGFDVGEYLVRFAETEHNLSSEATLVTIGEFNQLLYDEILAEMQKYYDNATIPNTVLKGEDVQDYVILLNDGASASNEISKNPSTVSNDLLTVKNGKLTLTDIVLKDAMDNTLDVSITFEKNGMILTKNVNVTIEKSEKGLIDITNEQINTISGLNSEVLDNEIIITGESNVPQIKTELYLPTGITARLATNVALQANTKWTIDGTLYIDKMMNDKSKTENFGTNGQLIFASETSSYRVIDKTAIGEYQGSLGVLTLDDSSEIILSSDKQTITISKGTVKIPAGKTLTLGDVSDFNSTEIDKGNLIIQNLIINDGATLEVYGTLDHSDSSNFYNNGEVLAKESGQIIGENDNFDTYTITFNANGGICNTLNKNTNSSGKLDTLPIATKENEEFLGWFIGETLVTTDTVFSKNTEVLAKFKEKPEVDDILSTTANEITSLNPNITATVLNDEIIIETVGTPGVNLLNIPEGVTARMQGAMAFNANANITIDGILYVENKLNDKSQSTSLGSGKLILSNSAPEGQYQYNGSSIITKGVSPIISHNNSAVISLSCDRNTITIESGEAVLVKNLTLGETSIFPETTAEKGNLIIQNLIINDGASIKVNGTFDYNGRNFTGNGTILVGNGTIIGEVETLSLSSVIEKQSGNINYSSTDSLTISITEKSLSSGDVFKLNAQTKPNNDEVIWSSSDENVATVDENGSVTAISSGFAIITAKKAHNSEKYATCYIEVIGSSVRPRPNDDLVENNQNIEIEETETPLTDGEKLKFTDISEHWAKNAIEYVVENELMNGISETEFAPNLEMSRAMIWTVLYRLDGNTDETGDIWYEKAMAWAVENEISDGTNPMDSITREQLITMLWRDAGEPVSEYDLSGYTDLSDVNDYAKVAFAWAVENGYISGKTETLLAPKDTATRAEVATILTRILDK